MDKVWSKFKEEIRFEESPSFEYTKILSAKLGDGEIFHIDFHVDRIIPFGEMQKFLTCLNNNFKYKTEINFSVTSIAFLSSNVVDYLKWIIGTYLQQIQISDLITESRILIKESSVTIPINTKTMENKINSISTDVNRIMRRFGFENFTLLPKLIVYSEDIIAQEKLHYEKLTEQAIKNEEIVKQNEKEIIARRSGYAELEIHELLESNEQKVSIKGEIFSVNHKTTKTELVITELGVTNFKDAIKVKLFGKKPGEILENQSFKIGDFVFVNGDYQFDSYSKEPVILARKIIISKNIKTKRQDNEDEKRIEFGARTKMSTMDGIVSARDLVERAAMWNHRAIAIADLESVQSFPEFYNAAKEFGIKGIYGTTFNSISKNSRAIYNPINSLVLDKDSYVIFDLETTGLSPIYEDIIEFGAIKVEDGQIVDKKQFFIKPNKLIPSEITRITNITNEMVKDAKSEEEAIKDIVAYLSNYTLVAHNANFDITFINEKLEKYNMKQLNNPIVDTMIVGRIVHPDAKRFKLENLAVRYGYEYNSLIAHRADYDAEILARIWIKMISDLKSENINSQEDLFNFKNRDIYSKAFSNEVVVIAKNQDGLKELFSLVSESMTTNFFDKPIIFLEDLALRSNVLLGSGALKSHLIERSFYGSKKQIREEISRYDFIQVQPIQNFYHLISKGFKRENIENAIKYIVLEAKKQNKIVIATGDVRYLDEKDKIFHEVYVNAKGLGGVRHYLFSYDNSNIELPTQNLLTTSEMLEAFSFLGDKSLIREIVIDNTNKLADSIENVQIIKEGLFTPKMSDVDQKLEKKVYESAYEKYGNPLPEKISLRINRELEPIKKYGFSIIYWISHLLVDKSLREGYLVGSRGSVGSSLVATLANITEVNPLEPHYICFKCKKSEFPNVHLNSGYDLPSKQCPNCNILYSREGQNIPFETFLGFEADKTPDIDLNFSGEYQPIIHNEVKKLFGEKHSFRAGTIATVAEKTAYGYVKAWAEEKKINISNSFIDYVARKVAGTKRTSGQHPGGIIIIPQEYSVEDFTPINYPANDISSTWKTTHFDFHAIHDNVLKLDLLGHDDPTAIKLLEKMTGVNTKHEISFNDEKIISLFSSPKVLGITPNDINGEATGVMGVPEFGTQFVRKMLRKAKVNSFGDLISISGLSHGTNVWTNNAEILVSNGKTLDEVISCRDNIMTDLIAKGLNSKLAFDIMERVRKGKGVSDEQENKMKEKGVEDWYIESLKKIEYMFPKAHATAYVMMAWRIAWFKLYKPLAYYATYFSTRADVFDIYAVVGGRNEVLDKLKEYESRRNKKGEDALTAKEENMIPILELINEAFARGINIANISLEKSDASTWVIDEEANTMYPPFTSVDGLGISAAQTVIDARRNSPFVSLEDLIKRTSLNKTVIEKLKELKVLDNLEPSNQISFDFGI